MLVVKYLKKKLYDKVIRNRFNWNVCSNVMFIEYLECKIIWLLFVCNVNGSKYV